MNIYVIPLILVFLSTVVFAWHVLENRQLKHHLLADNAEEAWLARLMRFAWSRTIQLMLILIGTVVLVTSYGMSSKRFHSEYGLMASQLEQAKSDLATQSAEVSKLSALNENSAKATTGETQPADGISTVFDASEVETGRQGDLDRIKKRYEELLISYYFLKKCQMVHPEDPHVINSAMIQEMASINAPSRLQYDVLTAAKGSYQEMYANTSCTQDGISNLSANFRNYINSIITRETR